MTDIEQMELNLSDAPAFAARRKVEAVLAQFPVGALFRILNDPYYEPKLLKVIAAYDFGIKCEDEYETVNNLHAGKLKHCFAPPTLSYYIEHGLVKHVSEG